ncbi:MAG: SsrA-binding protein SmpB [bacterium]
METICTNRKVWFNYEILETIEAGISLTGCEVKGLRERRGNISEAFARIENNECFLYNCHISQAGGDLARKKKLLLHKYQIERLRGKIEEKRMALVPTKMYFKKGRVKVELGLGRGKRLYDKREAIKKKIHNREIERGLKNNRQL